MRKTKRRENGGQGEEKRDLEKAKDERGRGEKQRGEGDK